MADQRKAHEIIEELTAAFAKRSDKAVLAKLAAIPPLVDEDDPRADDGYWQDVVYPYLALWNVAADRRLKAAIPLMLDRACYGDPGEIMRNLCHALEAIVEPDYAQLSKPCMAAARSPRAGTRQWAIVQLRRLRERRAIPLFEKALDDSHELVRDEARAALEVLREEAGSAPGRPVKVSRSGRSAEARAKPKAKKAKTRAILPKDVKARFAKCMLTASSGVEDDAELVRATWEAFKAFCLRVPIRCTSEGVQFNAEASEWGTPKHNFSVQFVRYFYEAGDASDTAYVAELTFAFGPLKSLRALRVHEECFSTKPAEFAKFAETVDGHGAFWAAVAKYSIKDVKMYAGPR